MAIFTFADLIDADLSYADFSNLHQVGA
ncbi:pentapeptide repeat-containing protein [Gloeothece verrucosa]